jgi:hypothetical protein
MKKRKVFFTPYGKRVLATGSFILFACALMIGHALMVHHQMNLIRADGGHWTVSATEKTVDGLAAIIWKKIGD